MKRVSARKSKGDCLIECAMGGVFLVVVGLFMLNAIAVLFANQIHDKVAFNAARAAANVDQNSAQAAARDLISRQPARKPIIQDIKLVACNYLPQQRVEVHTQMTVGLPAPLPCLPKSITFQARSIQPVVYEAPSA